MTDPYEALFKRTTLGIKPGLEIITGLLETMGNPHHRLAAIHVAGTNGKGSVCCMIESILRASGFKTGLYTSPHLIDFSERFRINGSPMPEARLNEYIVSIEAAADRIAEETAQRPATFFEISTAIAFQYFADEGVDVAVIETGMGGRWDATNVLIPLLSVITHIDVDHTDYLGDTIEQIAAEKAGIIKPGRPVVSAPQCEPAMAELQRMGESVILSAEAASVNQVGKPQKVKIETPSRSLPPIRLPLLGECQRENCAVAVAALEVLADMLEFEPAFKPGLEAVEWTARFQAVGQDPLVILDGAHNPSAGRALAQTLKELYPRRQVGFIFGFLEDKESAQFLKALKPLVAEAWTIPIDAPRGASAEASAATCRAAGFIAEPSPAAQAWTSACDWAAGDGDRMIVITGSLYLKQEMGL